MTDSNTTSLAVWDVPLPVILGEMFRIKVGVTRTAGRIEVFDDRGTLVASGMPGDAAWPGSEALFWAEIDVPSPAKAEVANYLVRCNKAETWFSVAAAAKPSHTVTVTVTERDTKTALGDVEIRLGPFHARTDKAGRAELRVCAGAYQLALWRTAHTAQPQALDVNGDASLKVTMVHVPEEHPDARWVR